MLRRINLDDVKLGKLTDVDNFFDKFGIGSLSNSNYPPYNLIQLDDVHFRIEMALAGFSKKDISIKLEDRKLVIESLSTGQGNTEGYYWHRGLAQRKFVVSFRLADSVVVKSAKLDSGLLTVELENVLPDKMKPKTIEIE